MSKIDIEFGEDYFAVLVRACLDTNAIDTMLFSDVEAAKLYCKVRWEIPLDKWNAYLVASDPMSTMKLNGQGVRYCGWNYEKDDTAGIHERGETFHIHLERKVVSF